MKSIYVTVKAQVFYDEDDVQARIQEHKLAGVDSISENDAIQSICTRAFDPVDKATIRDVIPDYSTIK
jgi:hypothetical protein